MSTIPPKRISPNLWRVGVLIQEDMFTSNKFFVGCDKGGARVTQGCMQNFRTLGQPLLGEKKPDEKSKRACAIRWKVCEEKK